MDTESTALVVYDHSLVQGLDCESRLFEFAGHIKLNMLQGFKADKKGGTEIGFGASVYNGAFILASYFEARPDLIKGKTVLELGCGPGLVGILVSILGAEMVLLTDGDQISVDLAEKNCVRNVPSKDSACVFTRKLLWGNGEDMQECESTLMNHMQCETFDVILAADVVALPYRGAYDDLLDTFQRVCSKTTVIYLCYQRRHHTEQVFFDKLHQLFHVEEMDQDDIHEDFRHNSVRRVAIYRITTRGMPN